MESELHDISGSLMDQENAQPPEPPFSLEEFQDRLHRMRQRMEAQNVDLIFVTSPEAMYYFHGYAARWYREGSTTNWPPLAGTAIHVDHDALIHFDFLDEVRLLERTSISKDRRFYPQEELKSALEFLMSELSAEGWLDGTVGLEFWSHVPNPAVSKELVGAFYANGIHEIVDISHPVRAIRRVKSPQEITYIEEAARICDIGHEAVRQSLRPGVTELEVYGEATLAMAKAGGEISGIVGAISSGPLFAGHALNSRRVIEKGDFVFYDPCGVYNRYHANLARGYFIGEPLMELVELHHLSAGSYAILEQTAKAGSSIPKVCRALRYYYEDVGIWVQRAWVGGYELGIAFPPDWVGEFLWTVEEETEGVFLENEVTNFESILNTVLIDTYVYEKDGARRLSKIEPELIVIS
jgi:Xaa-Pro aminopeptidase